MYDIIGDVHGHASQLEALLKKLGYEKKNGCYRHSERTAIFVGDLIDRGPEINEVLSIAQGMVTAGSAVVVMGNHEFNALAYNTPDPEQPGEFLRPHAGNNLKQYKDTLGQVKDVDNMLAFFYSMPLWLDLPKLRVVHACWDPDAIKHLDNRLEQRRLDHESLVAASRKGTEMYHAIETTLKGKEYSLGDITFADEGGKTRNQARVRWYLPYKGQSIAEYSFQVGVKLPESPFDKPPQEQGYHPNEKPVFFGHYWLPAKRPELQADNVCCLDYSVARGGHLCAYRFNADEPTLSNENYVWVGGKQ